jgi:hypothetical protein
MRNGAPVAINVEVGLRADRAVHDKITRSTMLEKLVDTMRLTRPLGCSHHTPDLHYKNELGVYILVEE